MCFCQNVVTSITILSPSTKRPQQKACVECIASGRFSNTAGFHEYPPVCPITSLMTQYCNQSLIVFPIFHLLFNTLQSLILHEGEWIEEFAHSACGFAQLTGEDPLASSSPGSTRTVIRMSTEPLRIPKETK